MAESLRDQLVKAGLATANQAKKAERQADAEKRANRSASNNDAAGEKQQKSSGKKGKSRPARPSTQEKVRQRARQQNAEKLEKDRELQKLRNEKAAAKALRAEIKQIIVQHDQRAKEARDDDVPYNFVHGKKIKKIHIPKVQQEQLSSGSLVIVNNDGRYHLVSREIGAKLSEKNPKCVIAAHNAEDNTPGPDDDYYAKFEVPDDLDW